MSYFLNLNNLKFIRCVKSEIFVDKSELIKYCNKVLGTEYSYMCVTRPRRFGKTMALSMLNAYYSKGCDSKEIFDKLSIANDKTYLENLNNHNVLFIDMAGLYTSLKNVDDFMDELERKILIDLTNKYNEIDLSGYSVPDAIKEINAQTGDTFIFLIDEWDVIFREEEYNNKLIEAYVKFLRSLFKAADISACIDLVYMTGILPIRRYSSQSALNMFREYNMIRPLGLESCFGFTEEETKELCLKYNMDFNLVKEWYDGYHLNNTEIYNPKSVCEALLSGLCIDYWVNTTARESVMEYMNYDNGALKDLITRMLTGEEIKVDVRKFDNDLTKINSSDDALTVLIHLGYLAYDEAKGKCYIPNHEIKEEFIITMDDLKWNDIYNPISSSEELLEKTLLGDTDFINETLDKNHNELATIFNKNKEDVLGIIVYISYYHAKKYYEIIKEASTTKGRADLVFKPKSNNHIPFIIELKADDTKENAIKQIKSKEYFDALGSYHGKVMLIGMNYDSKTLKHDSKIETIEI